MVEFELFLEQLFMNVMLGKMTYPASRVSTRIDVRSAQVLDPLIRGSRPHADWFPYHETEQRAKRYLRGGRPFTEVDASDKDAIEKWLWIRNAIAHSSRHSCEVFKRRLIGGLPLPPRERTPQGSCAQRFDSA
jgi:hypothetical protein